jgi:nucleoside-diphosphate-sugar epimerase
LNVPERIAVITGGAGAIGTAVTGALQAIGHRTVVLDRNGDVDCDLSSEASTRRAGLGRGCGRAVPSRALTDCQPVRITAR